MNTDTPLKRGRSLVDLAVDRIGQDIVSGRFAIDDNLPNETEWCTELEISRSVLREALRVLVSKNLMTIRARRGGRISPRSEWNILDPKVLQWLSNGDDPYIFGKELFELRRIIEPAAARIAASRITEAQVDALRAACREMADAGEDTACFIGPDKRFHHIILEAVGNSLFQGLAQTIMAALDMTLRMTLNAPGGQQRSLPMHVAVMEALTAGDADAAHDAMHRLVDESARDADSALALTKIRRVQAGVAA